MTTLPPYAGPFTTTLTLTAEELLVLRNALVVAEKDYDARQFPRKHHYRNRMHRLTEKVDFAIVETQGTTPLVSLVPLEDPPERSDPKRDVVHCEVCRDGEAVTTFMGVPHCARCAP